MEPLLAEIRAFAFGFVPRGWLACQGQTLAISQNQALFSVLGTTYGGNGMSTFALPDLRFRSPQHVGSGRTLGEQGGEAAHTLSVAELPVHTHAVRAAATATTAEPANARWATTDRPHYGTAAQTTLHPGTISGTGGSQAHTNMPPYLGLQYAIATEGAFPSRDGGAGGSPYVGEIRFFAGNFAPGGWATCDGQLMAISQNTALFSLLGTYYGGNGQSTFALPDLQGATPIHQGQGPGLEEYFIGQQGGAASVTLLESEIPSHSHTVRTVPTGTRGTSGNPSGGAWATSTQGRLREQLYSADPAASTLSPQAVSVAGGGQPHNNLSPYLAMTAIIALQGVYPPRS